MKIILKEHSFVEISSCLNEDPANPLLIAEGSFAKIKEESVRIFKQERGKKIYPFILQQKTEQTFQLQADYYIGIDWLIPGVRIVQVEPKVNKKLVTAYNEVTDIQDAEELEAMQERQKAKEFVDADYTEVDYLKILLDIMSSGLAEKYTNKFILIDWNSPRIPVTQKEDRLTPFLVVQFLQLLKIIVRKGLKKSYYKVRENLCNRVKGKISVSDHIKQNILKNRPIHTFCEYQVFGEDNVENRFLKKVFCFVSSYIENNKACFMGNEVVIDNLVNYCRPALEYIGNECNEDKLKETRHNPFFKEYKEAIVVGKNLLNKFSYNITETSTLEKTTPPFWIDMPKLFELYCYIQFLKANPEDKHHIHYQFSTHGNMLDILVSKPNFEMVIDTKYKLKYKYSSIHQDIRQVAGYARLKLVREKLGLNLDQDQHIDCLIIYPNMNAKDFSYSIENLLIESSHIVTYYKVFKLGVKLPIII